MACDSLLVVTEIRQALAEARSLDDVLAIREHAEKVRRLRKLQGESLAAQNEMAEITARADIMLGKSLAAMEKSKGRIRRGCSLQPREGVSLAELGIEKTAAHRWQTMALAERRVAKLLRDATDNGQEFTRAMVYREGQRIRKEAEGESPHAPARVDPLEFINALREACDKVWDKCPEQWRDSLPHVLRSIADEFEERLQDGHGRRTGTEAASVA